MVRMRSWAARSRKSREAALLFRGQLVDAREIGEAGAGLFPERS
jgi:hypothetical protein